MDVDNLSDDVFEEDGEINPKYVYHKNDGLNMNQPLPDDSPTGYPGYKPPKEALRLYALKDKKNGTDESDTDDGWRSFKIDEDERFDETVTHKVCYDSIYRCLINANNATYLCVFERGL